MLEYGYMAPTMFAGLIVFLLFGFPVAFSLSALGLFFGMLAIEVGYFGPEFLQALPYRTFGIMSNDLLLAIPFFTFMGAILERSGLAEDLLEGIGQLFGSVPGGLAYAVIIVGAILGAITGTVAASVIAMGMISLPIMLKYGYDMRIGTGVIAASGTITQVIPPSLVLIVLADQIGVSVGRHVPRRGRPLDPADRALPALHPRRVDPPAAQGAAAAAGGAHAPRLAADLQGALGDGAVDGADLPRARHHLHGPRHADRGRGHGRGRRDRARHGAWPLQQQDDVGGDDLDHADHLDGGLHPDRRDRLQPGLPGRERRPLDRAHPGRPAGRAWSGS